MENTILCLGQSVLSEVDDKYGGIRNWYTISKNNN